MAWPLSPARLTLVAVNPPQVRNFARWTSQLATADALDVRVRATLPVSMRIRPTRFRGYHQADPEP